VNNNLTKGKTISTLLISKCVRLSVYLWKTSSLKETFNNFTGSPKGSWWWVYNRSQTGNRALMKFQDTFEVRTFLLGGRVCEIKRRVWYRVRRLLSMTLKETLRRRKKVHRFASSFSRLVLVDTVR